MRLSQSLDKSETAKAELEGSTRKGVDYEEPKEIGEEEKSSGDELKSLSAENLAKSQSTPLQGERTTGEASTPSTATVVAQQPPPYQFIEDAIRELLKVNAGRSRPQSLVDSSRRLLSRRLAASYAAHTSTAITWTRARKPTGRTRSSSSNSCRPNSRSARRTCRSASPGLTSRRPSRASCASPICSGASASSSSRPSRAASTRSTTRPPL